MVLQNVVGQIHNIVHPNPTQKIFNLWNIFKNYLKPRFWKSCFIQILHIRIMIFVCFASPWPTGFEPTGVLTKSRFRSSGVTEWCWTNSQCSPSKSHPKNTTIIETFSKNISKWFQTQILEEFFQLLYLNIITCCFFASPWPTGFGPTGILTKSRFRSSGVTVPPKKATVIETSSKNYLKPLFWRSFVSQILYIKVFRE